MPGGWGLARAGGPKLEYGWGTKGKMMGPEKFTVLLWCLNPTVLKANQPPAHQYLGSGKEGKTSSSNMSAHR